jgi:hypothetical protein
MKLTIAAAIIVLSGAAYGQTYNPLETTDQLRQRRSAENHDAYRSQGNQAPLGGYREPLGSPSPSGTERPGYTSPTPDYRRPSQDSRDDLIGGSRQKARPW